MRTIKNFKKSILWRQGKLDDINNFDSLYSDYLDDIIAEVNSNPLTSIKKRQNIQSII